MLQPKRIKYDSLNTLKGLACIGVVIMHCGFPDLMGRVIHYCFKFNVPVFLLISGFFLFSADAAQESGKIRRQLPKIARMLAVSWIFYGLFCALFEHFTTTTPLVEWAGEIFRPDTLIQKLLLGTFFNGTLWYLYAVVWGYVVLLAVSRWYSLRRVTWLAPILLVCHVVLRTYVRAQGYAWYDASFFRSFILYAIPFILTGYAIAQHKEWVLTRGKDWHYMVLALLGFVIQFVEYGLFQQSLDFYFGSILYSLALFVLAIRHPSVQLNAGLNYLGEKLSMPIYIIHLAVIMLWSLCDVNPYLRPLSVIVSCIVVAYLWNYLVVEKRKLKR